MYKEIEQTRKAIEALHELEESLQAILTLKELSVAGIVGEDNYECIVDIERMKTNTKLDILRVRINKVFNQ